VELTLNLPDRRRRGRSRKHSKKGYKDDITPTTYLSRKSYENLTSSTLLKKPSKKRRNPLPFEEEEDDELYHHSIEDNQRRRGNKSEFSNSKGSRSRSGLRRYRSKSEDIYERRKNDEQSEELGKIARSAN